jgi:DNA-binding GntR family transcriptional regulator
MCLPVPMNSRNIVGSFNIGLSAQIDHARKLLNGNYPPSRDEVAALFNVSHSTLYRALAGL